MNIKILDSWLKEYLDTKAPAKAIADALSLSSVSIERVENVGTDHVYDIEVTTNRPDLASVVGLAREASAVLPEAGIPARFISPHLQDPKITKPTKTIKIINDNKLVNRIVAVVMEVTVKKSPETITKRLETSGIRSLNNIIDITNYVMRAIGHPAHVFDFDRLNTKSLIIRESKKGETVTTLDNKTYTLPGSDIVAENDRGEIVDLLGIMGLNNSVVTDTTKRILFFIDNNEPTHIRRTSMTLGIRTEAAQLNEKSLDPEIAMDALLYGIDLYETYADGKVLSEIIDIYPNKRHSTQITISEKKINDVIGVSVPLTKAVSILTSLGFKVETKNANLTITPPSFRAHEVTIPEDIIEEIARVYGYHRIPSILPPVMSGQVSPFADTFFWEKRIKDILKYWGFVEVYTYSMVSEELYDGPIEDAVTIENPLTEDFVYMRNSLVLSLLKVISENRSYEDIRIFELANVYTKDGEKLPKEKRLLTAVIKQKNASFFVAKGIVEQMLTDLGIRTASFTSLPTGKGAEVHLNSKKPGIIEILDDDLISFTLDFDHLASLATLKKVYVPLPKYPAVVEDITFVLDESIPTENVIKTMKKQNTLLNEVTLIDRYHDARTFHMRYMAKERNLTSDDVTPIRKKIIDVIKKEYKADVK